MKALFPKIIFTVLLLISLVLTGCNEKQKFIVRHATIANIAASLKDYAGINGYTITFSNEDTTRTSFRVYVGRTTTIIPATTETIFQKNKTDAKISTQETPPQQLNTDWSFGIQLFQRGDDVSIQAQSSGGFDPGQYVRGYVANLVDEGYVLENAP